MLVFELNKNQRRKLSIFFKCVLFSVIAWVLFAVSNKYIYSKTVGLEYINFPENKAFMSLQPDSAVVSIEATGWQLLFTSLTEEDRLVQVDLSGLQNRDFISFANQIGFINRQFPSNQRVVSVAPDTLFFDFSAQTEKRVPVRVIYDLGFARRFGLVGPIGVSPEYVTVRGPREEIVAIRYWETDTLRLSGLNGPVEKNVVLDTRHQPNLKVSPTHVDVQIPVGEMTEKEIQVPIEVINDESYRAIKLLPGKVKLTVLVSLIDYAQIGPESFRAIVDMKDWDQGSWTTLPVKILKLPDYCKLVRAEPQNVDFFVNK